ncbi:hypothetical protein KKB44_05520 [Candidatus Micrarchaeota archaeon]|nr:hypothetical protein [Candidatus Micrarchaeota archaeon]
MVAVALRTRDYNDISRAILSIASRRTKSTRSMPIWGSVDKTIDDVLNIMNAKRGRDGRPPVALSDLHRAITSYLRDERNPLVEEYTDALANVREMRLGGKFQQLPLFDFTKE